MSETARSNALGVVVLLVLLLFVVVPLLGMGAGMLGLGPMGMWGVGVPGWMVLVGVVMQLGFLLVVAAGLYLVYRAFTTPAEPTDPAMEELRLAYARGDLSEEEYERRREQLQRES